MKKLLIAVVIILYLAIGVNLGFASTPGHKVSCNNAVQYCPPFDTYERKPSDYLLIGLKAFIWPFAMFINSVFTQTSHPV